MSASTCASGSAGRRAVRDHRGRVFRRGRLERPWRCRRRGGALRGSARGLPGAVQIVRSTTVRSTIVQSVRDVQATLYLAFGLVVLVIFVFLGAPPTP